MIQGAGGLVGSTLTKGVIRPLLPAVCTNAIFIQIFIQIHPYAPIQFMSLFPTTQFLHLPTSSNPKSESCPRHFGREIVQVSRDRSRSLYLALLDEALSKIIWSGVPMGTHKHRNIKHDQSDSNGGFQQIQRDKKLWIVIEVATKNEPYTIQSLYFCWYLMIFVKLC